ncbi:MAG: hypothetical protein IJK14_02350 [Clostridia bacterium]|nr:hypothetical protein [Clostridia bacterium]MBR0444201.1 hypothetical protein [Clostridia bacterium]
MESLYESLENWKKGLNHLKRYHLTPFGYAVATILVIALGLVACGIILF